MENIFHNKQLTPSETVAMASTILQMKIDADQIITTETYDVRHVGKALVIDDYTLCRIDAAYAQVCDAIDMWAGKHNLI